MQKMTLSKSALFLAAALSSTNALAESSINFNGFASIVGGVTLSDNETQFGYDDSISLKPESRFALQATADLGDGLTVTSQILAQGENDFNAEFEWAFVSYEMTDKTTVRAGRLRLPVYLYSDYIDVGYAYPWVRPSSAMYNLPFTSYEGLSILHRQSWGDLSMTANASFGSFDSEVQIGDSSSNSNFEKLAGVNLQFDYDFWINAYVSVMQSNDITIGLKPAEEFAELASMIGVGDDVANNFVLDGDRGVFMGAGVNIDRNDWLVTAEYSKHETRGSFLEAANKAHYISVGHRFGKFTPFFMFEKHTVDSNQPIADQLPETPVPNVGSVFDGAPLSVAGLALLNEINREDYRIINFGTRYDFHDSASLKFQYSQRNDNLSSLNDAEVLSASLDLIF